MSERRTRETGGGRHAGDTRLLGEAAEPEAEQEAPQPCMSDAAAASGSTSTWEHPVMGRVPYETMPTRFSAKREALHGPAPCLGEHTAYVLSQLLGMSADAVAELAPMGVLE